VNERPITHVPRFAIASLVLAAGIQLLLQVGQPRPMARAQDLPEVPSGRSLQLASFGEPIAIAKLLSLYLQVFDTQPGVKLQSEVLDYKRVQDWLLASLLLDPRGQYPLFSASHIYAEVRDEQRARQMLAFVREQFDADPNRRWPWLAHAVLLARHRLKDLPLAREYARALRLGATAEDVPHWAQQMEIFLMADMSEIEGAKLLLGGLLASGRITDEQEAKFLERRLRALGGNVMAR